MPEPTPPPSILRENARGRRVRGFVKCALILTVFCAALIGSATLLDHALPPLAVPGVDEKLAHFAAHIDDYDTLFFGTSRTYHQIVPRMFDRLTGEAGVPTRSFNFGIDGMFPPEDSYVAERLFALHPTRLKRVFIEISFFRRKWVGIDPDSTRALHWHDLTRLGCVVRELCTEDQPIDMEAALHPKVSAPAKKFRWKNWRKNLDRTIKRFSARRREMEKAIGKLADNHGPQPDDLDTHVRLCFRRMLNLGRGARLLASLDGSAPPQPDWNLIGPLKDGACLVPHPPADPPGMRERFEALRAERTANPQPLLSLSEPHGDNVKTIVQLVREAGAEPILVVAPDVHACRRFLASEPRLPIFDFSQPAEYPQLYQTENRIDLSHLDEPGARLWTREFARLFIAHEQQIKP